MATLHAEIGKVLSIIHDRPEEKWKIDRLAKETAISRTKLFNTFTKAVGISPIQYLTNWRIDLSKQAKDKQFIYFRNSKLCRL